MITIANLLGGFSMEASNELHDTFGGNRHSDVFNTPDGTQEQADAVCEFLRAFQERWKRKLEKRIILPGGKVQP